MKIAILGSRGIPARFGGFETCAEKLSLYFHARGHEVTVYNADDHVSEDVQWRGIHIRKIFSKEKILGSLSSFVFDFLSLRDVVRRNQDIILELGYSPAALFYFLNKKGRAKIVTNMAGMEWKRSKWSPAAQKVIKWSEKIAIEKSDALIADNYAIKEYILARYEEESVYIPYGALLPGDLHAGCLETYRLRPYSYYMLMARFQPDNNIEMILDGYVLSKSEEPFVVVGGHQNKYGESLLKKYKAYAGIRFLGGIYNDDVMNPLRVFSKMYFHGHSAGGTNPSLLEAMAASAYIAAHDNTYNRYVLENDAHYFSSSADVTMLIKDFSEKQKNLFLKNNLEKIKNVYQWDKVGAAYLRVFESVLAIAKNKGEKIC